MRKFTCFICFLFFLQFLSAQVYTESYSTPKVGPKGLFGKSDKIKIHSLSELDTNTIKRELGKNEADKPFEFAKVRPLNLSINSGDWEISNDTAVWRLKVISKKALSTTINFDRFHLPEEAEMYIYNEEGTMITGPITSKENNPENVWGSSIYKGEGVIIEIKLPAGSKDKIDLHINSIAHGYKKIFTDKVFGQSGTCNINILCPLGSGWDIQRNSTALVLNASGNEHCSGSLINNSCNNLRPYFLTANHCYTSSSAGSVANWRFIFQYWSPTCTPNQNGSRSVLFNGSILRANSSASDFALLELNQLPPANSGITYSGWSRATAAPAFTTGIHHPSGDVMKISRDNNASSKTAYLGGTGTNHWQVSWDQGVTEGGSSGSPLYDANQRIIGQLHGGYSNCSSSDLRDWYGALDVSWTGGGTDATRLSTWLDPAGTGTTTLDAVGASRYSISGASKFCTEETYSLSNIPSTIPITWTISPSGVVNSQVTNNTIKLSRRTDGIITLTASVNLCGSNLQRSMNIIVGGEFNGYYYVNGVYNTLIPEISGSNNVAPGTWTIINATSPVSSTPQWTYVGGYGNSWYMSSNQLNLNIQTDGYAAFQLDINTNCGMMSEVYIFEANGYNSYYTVSPNPATTEVSISIDEEKVKKLKSDINLGLTIQKLIVLDKLGNAVLQGNYPSGTRRVRLNTSTLRPDLYIVKIFDGKQWNAARFIKK